MIPSGEISTTPAPELGPITDSSKYRVQYSWVMFGARFWTSFHLAMKSTRACDLIAVSGAYLIS
jgi:hypothetical protein